MSIANELFYEENINDWFINKYYTHEDRVLINISLDIENAKNRISELKNMDEEHKIQYLIESKKIKRQNLKELISDIEHDIKKLESAKSFLQKKLLMSNTSFVKNKINTAIFHIEDELIKDNESIVEHKIEIEKPEDKSVDELINNEIKSYEHFIEYYKTNIGLKRYNKIISQDSVKEINQELNTLFSNNSK